MSNLKQLESDASKALNCLYLEVSKEIADDVNAKVRAYVNALWADIIMIERVLDEVSREAKP